MDKQLTIVRDRTYYNLDNNNDVSTNEHYKEFMSMKIEAPCQYKPTVQAEPVRKDKREDATMKSENDPKSKVTQEMSNLKLVDTNKVKIDVPDLFANVRVKDLDNWL
jgi:hypothetical protein